MPGCIIRCSNFYPDEQGEVLCSPIEYETAWSLGANCGIDDLDTVARLNRICNDVSKLGESVLEAEREFNRLAGFTQADDRLPEFFRYEPLPPHNTVFDVPDAQLDTINAYPARAVSGKTA